MENIVAVNIDDMVTYIHTQFADLDMEVDEETIRAMLDAETDYYINYANEGEDD